MKNLFLGTDEEENDPELQALRPRHGMALNQPAARPRTRTRMEEMEDYDPWKDVRNMRAYFFFGSWVTHKFRPVGEEKLKKQLRELEKKRLEEEMKKNPG
ncbi:MAG: hypothetical protein N2506_05885 [Dehalococcoidales bacterium]|nr:hypothetical protein [Dehalococcoidales bacterium]